MNNATTSDIAVLREGGALLASILQQLTRATKPGVSTAELDVLAQRLMREADATPSFLGYRNYPAVICASVNDAVVHAIPSDTVILKEGDILGIDIGIIYKDRVTDMAVTIGVGEISQEAQRLIAVTRDALATAIAFVRPGITTGDLGAHIQTCIEKEKFGVVRDLVGHGVGMEVHEDPMIPNFGTPGTGEVLKEHMIIAIEPMVTAGKWQVRTRKDGWTVETADHSLAAHFEHTIAITNDGALILTQTHGDHPWP